MIKFLVSKGYDAFRWGGFSLRSNRGTENPYRYNGLYRDIAGQDLHFAYALFKSGADGLLPDQVELRAAQYGPNQVVHKKPLRWHTQLLKTVRNPFILLLTVLALISFVTGDTAGGALISIMVVLSVVLTFFQEYRSGRAAEKLRAMVSTNATVRRRRPYDQLTTREMEVLRQAGVFRAYELREVPIDDLVPGDVVSLSAGDMIPADLRVISSKDLFVSQSAMTGESLPVEKFSVPTIQTAAGVLELSNLLFMGSNVVSGTATALVMKTGARTYLGNLSSQVVGQRVETSFDKGIQRFTGLMLKFMFVMVPLVFLINGLAKGNWVDAFLFALAVAVGLTPEMLPMIVTVNLAKGALSMSRKKVIVKRLGSIQNFGAMDVLCTDKTGTLTRDKVVLEQFVDLEGERSEAVLRYAALNSYHQTGLKNLIDSSVLERAEREGKHSELAAFTKVDEIPFDFTRRRMSVVVEKGPDLHELICKGALEEIMSVCNWAERAGEIVPLSPAMREGSLRVADRLNQDGLRVIAVARRRIPGGMLTYSLRDERDLILVGFIAFLDPPKETAAQAITALGKAGVAVKVLTGDNDVVTRNVCRQVGISVERIVLGNELEFMTDEELSDVAERVSVFAKLTPEQKRRIIAAMHAKGHVVGFLGDGINDSPALRTADVGISVDNAVDIAKESADIILLEKNLLVLEEGVIEGRKVFGNIVKYLKMGASSNFGNVFSLLGASLFLPFLPMLPVQLLIQNLLYDLSQTAIPFDRVDLEYLARPRKWEIGDIGRLMLGLGPLSSLFDYATFALLWYGFGANTTAHQALFHSGWFVEGLLSQTLIVHMIRTQKVPFFESTAALPLVASTVLVMAVGVYLPFSPLAPKLGLVALPVGYFPWLVAILVAYALSTQWLKQFLFNLGERRLQRERELEPVAA